jgi:putative ATP-dependent endonuclease of the OLD family
MTKNLKDDEPVALTAAKVKRLIIRNFRCIGPEPVCIDLDDIVVLVGPNNAGKSTILRAYEVVMMHGSNEGHLQPEDFHSEKVDPMKLPEIELETYIWDNFPKKRWMHTEQHTGKQFVRERWIWNGPREAPKRQGYCAEKQNWDEKVQWGAPGVANARRPFPCRVDAFASPEEQGDKIIKLLQEILTERASNAPEGISAIEHLTQEIRGLQERIVSESQGEITDLENDLSAHIGDIFVGFRVSLDTRNDQVCGKALNMFPQPVLRMGPTGGHMAPLNKQGSGARRTLLWSALKIASERKPKTSKAKKPRS